MTPLLLLLLLGAVELGRYAYFAILVGNAARAGVAYGAQNVYTAAPTNDAAITAAVCNDYKGQNTCSLSVSKNYLCQCDNAGAIGSSIDCVTGSCPSGQHEVVALQVTASGTYQPLFHYTGINSITVSSTATLRIE